MSLRDRLLIATACVVLSACASTGGGNEPRSARKSEDPDARAAALQVNLGSGYMQQGKYETAHQKLERALELDPNSVNAHTLMAVLYERLNRPKFSEKHYRRAVELDPDDGSTNNNFGAYLCRLERFDEADAYFLRAVDDPFYKTPDVAYSNAGVCAARAKHVDKAEAYFRKALEANPNESGALYEMALISFAKNDYLRARAFYQRFEAAAQPDPAALEFAASIEDKLGNSAAAAKYRERLKTEFPDYEPGVNSEGSKSP
jgi:type IV pilus assembly protein PilF